MIIKWLASGFLLLFISGATCGDAPTTSTAFEANSASFVIDSRKGCLAGICTGMTESALIALGYVSSRRSVILEGDAYTIIDVSIGEGTAVEALLDSGSVDRFSITSPLVRVEEGIGVGVSLAKLKEVFEDGRLFVGEADGRFANFVNGTRVVFELDRDAFSSACFDARVATCAHAPDARILRIVVHSSVVTVAE